MGQELVNRPALLRVPNQALGHEVTEFCRPLARDQGGLFVDYRVEQGVYILALRSIRWLTGCELECETAKRPDVDFFRVGDTFGDLRGDPRWSAFLSLSVLGLLG